MIAEYRAYLASKRQRIIDNPAEANDLPQFLFPFQRRLVSFAIEQGRAAIFADCGLGKTPMQLVWADIVARRERSRVLVLTPLAVTQQTLREAAKFGIEAAISRDGVFAGRIVIANYERLHYFNPKDFAGIVCDESSILKSFNGARRKDISIFMRQIPYRLLCTATAAPNDYTELGTSSEALGYLGHMDMLGRFFVNDQRTCDTKQHHGRYGRDGKGWRFKGHAVEPFWRWVCSWARALRAPSDIGFDDDGFTLPPLHERTHEVIPRSRPDGMLFNLPAVGLAEERAELRRTLRERCEMAASLVDHAEQAIVWCHLNAEGDMLAQMIPDAVQVAGSDSDDVKEDRLVGFQRGRIRVLITKPKIGAWGLNLQKCHHIVYFPSHSFEQYYQAVRRCWRFGQEHEVMVDVVATIGQRRALKNMRRKAAAAQAMFEMIVRYVQRGLAVDTTESFGCTTEVPSWLSQSK